MKKDEISTKFREYARNLSPQPDERELISKIYKSVDDLLANKCLQIGSYPRFTAVTPVHDLDILYILGQWSENNHSPSIALQQLFNLLTNNYKNPTKYTTKISMQTHSVTISYMSGKDEIISVDIVPAYIYSKNSFDEDMYKVPEVLTRKHGEQRRMFYQELSLIHKDMDWIASDPRGYIKVASDLDKQTNGEFRKSVKIVKCWIYLLAAVDDNLKLKSFHIEQVITLYFLNTPNYQIFDVIFRFFKELPGLLENPNQIKDRANDDKYIDDYLKDFTLDQKQKIREARDNFLIKLEDFSEDDSIEELVAINFYQRASLSEKYLFDEGIPVLITDTICINGWIQKDNRDFRRLNAMGFIDNGYKIRFEAFMSPPCDLRKWKVKNDNKSPQPRGEITDNHTKNAIEETRYTGKHYVDCYAIKNNVCIAKARQNVVIR